MTNEYKSVEAQSSCSWSAEDDTMLLTNTLHGKSSLPTIDESLIRRLDASLYNRHIFPKNGSKSPVQGILQKSFTVKEVEDANNSDLSKIIVKTSQRDCCKEKIPSVTKNVNRKNSNELGANSISTALSKEIDPVVVLHRINIDKLINDQYKVSCFGKNLENNVINKRKLAKDFHHGQTKTTQSSPLELSDGNFKNCGELSLSIDLSTIQNNKVRGNNNGRSHSTPLSNFLTSLKTGDGDNLGCTCGVVGHFSEKLKEESQNKVEIPALNKYLNKNPSEKGINELLSETSKEKNCLNCKINANVAKIKPQNCISRKISKLGNKNKNNKNNLSAPKLADVISIYRKNPTTKVKRRLIFSKPSKIPKNIANFNGLIEDISPVSTVLHPAAENDLRYCVRSSSCVRSPIKINPTTEKYVIGGVTEKYKNSGENAHSDELIESAGQPTDLYNSENIIQNKATTNILSDCGSLRNTDLVEQEASCLKAYFKKIQVTTAKENINTFEESTVLKNDEIFDKNKIREMFLKKESLPKLVKPAKWINKQLYSFLEAKLNVKYPLEKRFLSEKLVLILYNEVLNTLAGHPEINSQTLKEELRRYDICNTQLEYYTFLHRFSPVEYIKKAIPMGRAYGNHDFKFEKIGINDPLL